MSNHDRDYSDAELEPSKSVLRQRIATTDRAILKASIAHIEAWEALQGLVEDRRDCMQKLSDLDS